MSLDPALRGELDALYLDCAACLDDDALEEWPGFFTADCVYRIVPRDNFDRGLPLALLSCESRDGLADRVRAVRETQVFVPRTLRHLVSGVRIREAQGARLLTGASFAVFETLPEEETRIKVVGRTLDVVVREDGRLRFAERTCVLDSVLIPGSLVVPV